MTFNMPKERRRGNPLFSITDDQVEDIYGDSDAKYSADKEQQETKEL